MTLGCEYIEWQQIVFVKVDIHLKEAPLMDLETISNVK